MLRRQLLQQVRQKIVRSQITSVFTVLSLSLQFSSKKHSNLLVTQHPTRLPLAHGSSNSPPRINPIGFLLTSKILTPDIGPSGPSINKTPRPLRDTMLPPSTRDKNTFKCEIQIWAETVWLYTKLDNRRQWNVNVRVKPHKMRLSRSMLIIRAKPDLKQLKAGESEQARPSHASIRSHTL